MNRIGATTAIRAPEALGIDMAHPEASRRVIDYENRQTLGEIRVNHPKLICRGVKVHYGEKPAIRNLSLDIGANQVTAFIGPSRCGKSTFLRRLNCMNDTIPGCRVTGRIQLDEDDIYDKCMDVVQLRARVGMVFQKPNPFPKSIYENVAYGPRIHGLVDSKAELDELGTDQPGAGRPAQRGRQSHGRVGYQPVRWPATKAVHRPCHRGEPRGDPDGRTLLRLGSHRHR